MASKGKSALTGAGTGAAVGAAAGSVVPGVGTVIGAGAGAIIGGIGGWFAGDDDAPAAPTYTPDQGNFQYGLGRGVDAQGNLQQPDWYKNLDQHIAMMRQSGNSDADIQSYIKAQQATNPAVQDSYAAQRTRELAGRQQQLEALGAGAQGRAAPTQSLVASNGQQYLQGADAAGRAAQLQALGGLESQTGALNQFANREQGPSAAQTQLQAGTDAAARQQFSFARAQPGGGGSALRSAAFNAAGISGNAANSAATLRAQEDQAFQAQRLQALGAAQQGAASSAGYAGQLRGADQGFAQTQAGQANYDAGAANQVGQTNLNSQLSTRGQNDSMTLGSLGLSQGLDSQRNAVTAGQSQTGLNYEAAKAQGAGLGIQSYNANNTQSNAETGMALGALSAGAGAVAQLGAKPQPGASGGSAAMTSDIRAKKDIVPVSMSHRDFPDAPAGDGMPSPEAHARQQQLQALGAMGDFKAPNMRPAQGYEYAYKDPAADGAGRYVGPMAQDLEHLPGVVEQGKDGKKAINAPRLTLANTAAVSELQRKQDELDRKLKLQALNGGIQEGGSGFVRPDVQQPDYAAYGAPGYHY